MRSRLGLLVVVCASCSVKDPPVSVTKTTEAAAMVQGVPVAPPLAPASHVSDPPGAVAVASAPAAPCEPYIGPRSFKKTIERPEGKRSFEVRMPPSSASWPAPVVVGMHGYGGNPLAFLNSSKLDEEASRRGFVTIAPYGYRNSFNGGDCCGNAKLDKIDDGAFVLAAVDEVAKMACVRTDHVNLTGFSNGGFMAQAIACQHADRVGSIVSVGGMLGIDTCIPARPVSVLLVNGSGDPIIPVKGGGPYNNKSRAVTIDAWRKNDKCDEAKRTRIASHPAIMCERDTCEAGTHVDACLVPYAHAWTVRGHPDNSKGQIERTAREIFDFIVEHEKL